MLDAFRFILFVCVTSQNLTIQFKLLSAALNSDVDEEQLIRAFTVSCHMLKDKCEPSIFFISILSNPNAFSQSLIFHPFNNLDFFL